MDLSAIRNDYQKRSLDNESVDENPIEQLELWLSEARECKCNEYTSMSLATVGENLQPSIRTVLLKYIKADGIYFFTNYHSRKGIQLEENNKAAALLFWPELERQVKIEGFVHKAAPEISDFYFKSRPLESQISAIISEQSTEVSDRSDLERLWEKESKRWEGKEIPRPEYWGGYCIKPNRIEFWQGRPFRLHDRLLFKKCIDGWKVKRLAP